MIFATHIPRPPLNQVVELLWFHEGYNAGHHLERVLPDGSMELIINLRDDTRHVFDDVSHRPRSAYRRSWLSGPHSKFIVIDNVPDASMIGVHLKPGGARAFFGLPLSELRNCVVELEALWNCEALSLRDHLLEAPTPLAKFRILEHALFARWRGLAAGHRVLPYALGSFTREPSGPTVGQVSSTVGLSRRRFIEVFTAEVGMTPKIFCRVRRFQRALHEIERRGRMPWSDLAIECGYYDQAHFIHDFKEFSGLTPGEYLAVKPEHPNFIPIRS